jgi:hypothetical protein
MEGREFKLNAGQLNELPCIGIAYSLNGYPHLLHAASPPY